MYPYNYNMYASRGNMRPMNQNQMSQNQMYQKGNGDRFFFPGGFLVPFVLGGIAGGAIANNKQNNYPYYPYPYPYPYPVAYNNYYYNPYYY